MEDFTKRIGGLTHPEENDHKKKLESWVAKLRLSVHMQKGTIKENFARAINVEEVGFETGAASSSRIYVPSADGIPATYLGTGSSPSSGCVPPPPQLAPGRPGGRNIVIPHE